MRRRRRGCRSSRSDWDSRRLDPADGEEIGADRGTAVFVSPLKDSQDADDRVADGELRDIVPTYAHRDLAIVDVERNAEVMLAGRLERIFLRVAVDEDSH